ncbi:hypothetical protein H7U34_01850 [Collinsella tanakaei]|nr:hypothetical protein [Collinsella tanakaei]
MFRARMTEHEVFPPEVKDDGLGFRYYEHSDSVTVNSPKNRFYSLMCITRPTQSVLNQNEFHANRLDATAFTFDEIEEHSLIDGLYEVVSVEKIKGDEFLLGLVKYGS